nr:VOC family protein [Anaerolineae bacterium]
MPQHPPIDSQITFLYTRDLEKTVAFYEGVLGLDLWLDQGTCRIYRTAADSYLGLCERKEMPDLPAGPDQHRVIFTLVTDAVDEWYKYLQEQGVEFEKPPQENPRYRIYHCFLRDPEGYLIEIQRFL